MDVRTSPARRLDGWDALILAMSTMVVPWARPAPLPLPLMLPAPAVPAPVSRAASPAPTYLVVAVPDDVPPLPGIPGLSWEARRVSRPLLMAWTTAFLIIRLRRPHPPWRRLASQPGLAACGLGTLVLVVQLAAIFLPWSVIWLWTAIAEGSIHQSWMYFYPRPPLEVLGFWMQQGVLDSASAGHAIAGTWLIMALGGWWRPERSAIDRLGRALGAAWIAWMGVEFAVSPM